MDKTAAQRAQLSRRLAYFKDNIQTQEDTDGFDASRYYYNRSDELLPGGGRPGSEFGQSAGGLGGGGVAQNGYAQQRIGGGPMMGAFGTTPPPPPPPPSTTSSLSGPPFFSGTTSGLNSGSTLHHQSGMIGGPRSPPGGAGPSFLQSTGGNTTPQVSTTAIGSNSHNTTHQQQQQLGPSSQEGGQQQVFSGLPQPVSSTTSELLSMLNKGLNSKPQTSTGPPASNDLDLLGGSRRLDISEFPALGPGGGGQNVSSSLSAGSQQQREYASSYGDYGARQGSAFAMHSGDFPALPTPAAGGTQQVQQRSRLGELRSGSDSPSLLSSLQREGSSLVEMGSPHALLNASGPLAAAPGPPGSRQAQSPGMMLAGDPTARRSGNGSQQVGASSGLAPNRRFLPPHAELSASTEMNKSVDQLPSLGNPSSGSLANNNTSSNVNNNAPKDTQSESPIISSVASGSGPTSTTTEAQRTKYGLMGLLDVIRMTNADLNTLALGSDLTTLGLNLNSSECLYSTFASPWSEEPTRREPQFLLPSCYYMQPPPLKTSHLAKFQLETLFYVFYAMPKDVLQAYAAQELYNREWQYHQDLKLWFKRDPKQTNDPSNDSSPNANSSQYIYFDIQSWDCRIFAGSSSVENAATSINPSSDAPLNTNQQQLDKSVIASSTPTNAQQQHGLSSGLLPQNDVRLKFNS